MESDDFTRHYIIRYLSARELVLPPLILHLPMLTPSCVTTKRVPCGRLSDTLTIILMQGSHSSSGGGEP